MIKLKDELIRYRKSFESELKNDPSPYYRNDWKIDPWKCPYHNGRAMMELMHRVDQILNTNNL